MEINRTLELAGVVLTESKKVVDRKVRELLKSFSSTDLEAILEDSGYTDNRIKTASFYQFNDNGDAVYKVEYHDDGHSDKEDLKGFLYVSIGKLTAEF